MNDDKTIFDEKVPVQETAPVAAPEVPKEKPREPRPVVIPVTPACPNGPKEQHEWVAHEVLGVVVCAHCQAKAEAVEIIGLYQKSNHTFKKEAFVLKERLEKELGHKVVLGKTRENCTTEREKELFDESLYFQQRLQEETDTNVKLKKDVTSTGRKVGELQKELALEVSKRDHAIDDLRKDRNKWKDAFDELQTGIGSVLNKMDRLVPKRP